MSSPEPGVDRGTGRRLRRIAAAVLALLAAVSVPVPVPAPGAATAESAGEVPTPPFETAAIGAVESHEIAIGGVRYTVSSYRNDAYRCGRDGNFPFVVLEQTAGAGEEAPLWVMLRGGGVGFYDSAGEYVTTTAENYNDAEPTGRLLRFVYRYVGPDGSKDTFVADRLRAGDRVALGSLCDHDLYFGLGQDYPNNPNHDDTVDGLLANLAMTDAVTNGAPGVERRRTSSLWIFGTSAGSFGAYALAHNLWARGSRVDGVVLDSGLLVSRVRELPPHLLFGTEQFGAKHGPYATDDMLWIDAGVRSGFDVALFDTVQDQDLTCAGRGEPVAAAVAEAVANNCIWTHAGLTDAIATGGDPALQQVHVYPGRIHTATDRPGTPVQDDLRAWYVAVRSAARRRR